MARWTAKELVLNTNSSQEAIIFLEAIQKQIKIVDIIADYYPGKITIRFEGAKENLKDAIDIAKELHQLTNGMLYPDTDGFYEYNIEFMSKMTGKTFPVKTLIQILSYKGIETAREEDTIFTKLKHEDLINLIKKIDKTLAEMPYEVSTSSLRHVIATISIVLDNPTSKTIELLKKIKAVEEDELRRLKLVMEPDQVIEKALKKTK